MKKILMSAALVAMAMVGCTSKSIVEESGNQLFTLEVGKGVQSRTHMNGAQLVWSPGDEIFVTSPDGEVSGVLRLISGENTRNGVFQGMVNGNPAKVRNIVYPADREVNLQHADTHRLIAPMTGTIGEEGENTLAFNCGFVKLNVLGLEEGDEVKISGQQIGSTLTYDLNTNSWVLSKEIGTITMHDAQDATDFIVPVYTKKEEPNTETALNVSVNDGESAQIIVNLVAEEVADEVPILAVTDNGDVVDPETSEDAEVTKSFIKVSTDMNLKDVIEGVWDKDTDKWKLEPAEDGAYIILKSGEHLVSSFFTIKHKELTIVGEDGAKIVDTLKEAWNAKTINTWGNYIDGRKTLKLTIKNVEFENRNGNNTNLWLRTYDEEAYESEEDVNCNYIFNVELENVKMGAILYDNYYNNGTIINLDLKNCDIERIVLQAYNKPLMKTYTNVTFDEKSNLGIFVDETYLDEENEIRRYAPEHMTVNGEVMTEFGCVVGYKN